MMAEPVAPKKPPTIQEFLAYAEPQIEYYIRKMARSLPEEQKEEIAQDVRVRLCNAHKKIDATKGWRALVQSHCSGAIKDYLGRGKGYEESKWAFKAKRAGDEAGDSIRFRETGPEDGEQESPNSDQVLDMQHTDEPEAPEGLDVKIRWDLLARMCSVDHDLHIFVLHEIFGAKLTEIAKLFGMTKERIGQRLENFVQSLDDPAYTDNPWINQIIYALGLCGRFGMSDRDQGLGWTYKPVDFSVHQKKIDDLDQQLTFFDLDS